MRAVLICVLLLGAAALNAEDIRVREIVAPQYPLLAWGARLQGSVDLQLGIDRDGKVQAVKASGGHPMLLEEASKNIRLWTFGPFPARTTFPVRLEVHYVYKLEGEEEYPMSQPRVVITLPNRVQIVARPPEPQTLDRGPSTDDRCGSRKE